MTAPPKPKDDTMTSPDDVQGLIDENDIRLALAHADSVRHSESCLRFDDPAYPLDAPSDSDQCDCDIMERYARSAIAEYARVSDETQAATIAQLEQRVGRYQKTLVAMASDTHEMKPKSVRSLARAALTINDRSAEK